MLAEHLEYQIALERSGTMFGAGPIYDEGEDTPSGGMIIVRATNFNEARKIADADPMHAHNLRRYTIEKWLLNEGSMTFTYGILTGQQKFIRDWMSKPYSISKYWDDKR